MEKLLCIFSICLLFSACNLLDKQPQLQMDNSQVVTQNSGYNPKNIEQIKQLATQVGLPFVVNDQQENDDQSTYFYFVGQNKGKEVIFDAFIYTLRAEYELHLYELAEKRLQEKFPNLKNLEEATEDQLNHLDMLVDGIEQEDIIRVAEFINVDEATEFGVAIDVCLHVDTITPEVISKFVKDFNNGALNLDDKKYSFSPYSKEE